MSQLHQIERCQHLLRALIQQETFSLTDLAPLADEMRSIEDLALARVQKLIASIRRSIEAAQHGHAPVAYVMLYGASGLDLAIKALRENNENGYGQAIEAATFELDSMNVGPKDVVPVTKLTRR